MNKHFMKTNCFAICFCAFVVAGIDSGFNQMIFFFVNLSGKNKFGVLRKMTHYEAKSRLGDCKLETSTLMCRGIP